jgi:hypothetical protein
MTCAQTAVRVWHWEGCLPRYDGGTSLVLGPTELTEDAGRAQSNVADVVGNLHERASECVESTTGVNGSIMGLLSFKFVGRSDEIDASELSEFLGVGMSR